MVPQNLRMEDRIREVFFAWEKPHGMKEADIKFIDSENEETTATTTEDHWISHPVRNGEVYEFKLWSRCGTSISNKFLRETYVSGEL